MKTRYPAYQFAADIDTLAQDIKDSFNSALQSLLNNEHKEDRRTPGWSVGFILGFVKSSLVSRWLYKYIYCQTEEYKRLMILKATILYLDFDQITTSKIEKIHKYLMDNEIYISKDCESVDKNVVFISNFLENKEKQQANKNFSNLIVEYLEQLMLQKHDHIFDKLSKNNYVLDIDQFFSNSELSDLINFCQENISY